MPGPSRTHGEFHGEKKDSLDSPEETPVVSATWPHIQTNDLYSFDSIFGIIF